MTTTMIPVLISQFDVINLCSKMPGLPDAPIRDPNKFLQHDVSLYTNGQAIFPYEH